MNFDPGRCGFNNGWVGEVGWEGEGDESTAFTYPVPGGGRVRCPCCITINQKKRFFFFLVDGAFFFSTPMWKSKFPIHFTHQQMNEHHVFYTTVTPQHSYSVSCQNDETTFGSSVGVSLKLTLLMIMMMMMMMMMHESTSKQCCKRHWRTC